MAKKMIKLQLAAPENTFESVKKLPGLADLDLDHGFGLVPLDPRKGLYAIRVADVDDLARRQRVSPEILGGYGDVKISTTDADG